MVATTNALFARDIASLDDIFGFVDEFIDEHEVDAGGAYCLRLVVEELFTNLVKYNRDGGESIGIRLSQDHDGFRLELTDRGVEPFDPDSIAPAPVTSGLAERRPGGLGLHLVRSLVDSLNYVYDPAQRSLKIEVIKRLE